MNNTPEVEVRPRPLSAGLWTLFSWLRRDDRSVSSDSLSSAGSDRTAASFAFLAPAHYRTTSPFVLPPPGPPTDSYKKRVHDRNLRRQHDRDLTLHRKYGLLKSDGGYDAFSLPPARRANGDLTNKWDRDRRAASECLQRRAVHVPGKRRAPAPPATALPGASASLPRRHSRKRPAPQPPRNLTETNKENYIHDINTLLHQMNSNSSPIRQKPSQNDVTGCKSEKYSKKDSTAKDVKTRTERNFLKQIFDNKKRNSAIETSAIKILPSISELDKQAAEIIQSMKNSGQNRVGDITSSETLGNIRESGTWFCVNCLRKYNPTVEACLYCLPEQKSRLTDSKQTRTTSSKGTSSTQTDKNVQTGASSAEEKQKLKEMLKEMKDSLSKKPKHDINGPIKSTSHSKDPPSFSPSETPTLRVGSTIPINSKILNGASVPGTSNAAKVITNAAVSSTHNYIPITMQNAVVTHNVIVTRTASIKHDLNNKEKMAPVNDNSEKNPNVINKRTEQTNSDRIFKQKNDNPDPLHVPLRISSLLNPVYVPKDNKVPFKPLQELSKPTTDNIGKNLQISSSGVKDPQSLSNRPLNDLAIISPASIALPQSKASSTNSQSKADIKIPAKELLPKKDTPVKLNIVKNITTANHSENIRRENLQTSSSPSTSTSKGSEINTGDALNQHIRRRTLITQLEQSIAKGDERAAADAAVKLAQLRLSCSVLSYSSQILANASTSTSSNIPDITPVKASVLSESKTNGADKLITKPQSSHGEAKQIFLNNVPQINARNKEKNTRYGVDQPLPSSSKASSVTQTNNNGITQVKASDQPSTSKSSPVDHQNDDIPIAVLVEDREATRGPVDLKVKRQANMRELRLQAQASLGLASTLQRWIIGRKLCTDDDTPVATLAGADFSAPFYLCIVESESNSHAASKVTNNSTGTITKERKPQTAQEGNFYTELVQLEQQALVSNTENFECGVCMEEYPAGNGVVLRDCVHTFCKECLSDVVRHCEEPDVSCPAMGCHGRLEEREIRALVTPEDYERWLARGLSAAESGTRNAFHCRTRDCKGWALCEPGVLRFPCPVCNAKNCVPCQAIHEGETCEQYQTKLKEASNPNQTDDGTRSLLNSLIRRGEALECPECKAIITKKWGCDWVKCSACKTEICWVTRGRRWGPAGRGDTSAGCRCGVDGKKCHPSCGYCH